LKFCFLNIFINWQKTLDFIRSLREFRDDFQATQRIRKFLLKYLQQISNVSRVFQTIPKSPIFQIVSHANKFIISWILQNCDYIFYELISTLKCVYNHQLLLGINWCRHKCSILWDYITTFLMHTKEIN